MEKEIDFHDIESVWFEPKDGSISARTYSCGCCSEYYGKLYDWRPQPTPELVEAYIERERQILDALEEQLKKYKETHEEH